ncbi:O-acetyl-ADP-ribose deacetylase [Desulfovulcanus sp.]
MSYKIYIKYEDLTKANVDAIVNAANSRLAGGGGVDGAIHRAAGPELLQACQKIVAEKGYLPPGQAVITPGFNLPAKYVIHTVGPIWHGGQGREKMVLDQAYASCLNLAKTYKIKTIAFPAISCGTYGFPMQLAIPIAINRCIKALKQELVQEIYFYLYSRESYELWVNFWEDEKKKRGNGETGQ